VTLRTPVAFDAIREMAKVEGAVVGAGTVLNERDLEASLESGARFIVSPGLTERLSKAAIESKIPFLPGIATAADIMRGLEMGLSRFKFFPAMAAGGIPALRALAAPFHQCRFCPTGGITQATAPDWLALDAVLCVGGSWLIPPGGPDPCTITSMARRAARSIRSLDRQ
jgi:2-dehydro-3-deoxyphosphogluconate aldolase/(4S)-4-hydroxy-2-oxoglutarate aldolase